MVKWGENLHSAELAWLHSTELGLMGQSRRGGWSALEGLIHTTVLVS